MSLRTRSWWACKGGFCAARTCRRYTTTSCILKMRPSCPSSAGECSSKCPRTSPFYPRPLTYTRHDSVLRAADGALTMDADAYHPEAAAALRAQFGAHPAVYAGPLISRGPGAPATPAAQEVQAFLDGQLRARGERSVLMISFGSMFWPSDPAKLQTVLDVVVEADIPFVMSCASPFSAISDETKSRLNASGNALLADWVPQEAVLKHAATGWCLTHAGHNSVLECIDANVPMILWPIDADQSTNAIHLSRTLRIAYELLEIRNGVGLGPIHETGVAPAGTLDAVQMELRGVLGRAFGSERGEGEEVRARLGELRGELREAWGEGEGGVARRGVEAFLDSL
ncbi:UDP-Glycosyltransferase/glycogen phosphorylase [Trametes versicolor FP-101664 SS1]|uniref:UDP-Glycosyltransferase/glycogen phosphorylase n=1 Tax=Trametes versicolor (strain FP-101664) TaxID=717944 RepID=R7S893_TRAVS|nr:UDP-Glycosyltransferase/glycogen phosphorylase [Trametes versicolor FP-101664 SS1]EIW51920.1 UDP-Glycosyltransferase/glycogen phosphorylase [Trametes versicolor FP-101664 SS1]